MSKFVLMRKKERWTVTWLGNILKFVVIILLGFWFVHGIHPFLAITKPVESDILVIEGFIPDQAVEEADKIFQSDNYTLMIITGNKRLKGAHLDVYENDGEFTAATLEKLGFERSVVKVVAVETEISRDRTYASALALRSWMEETGYSGHDFNLLTLGAHARRSRYLFQKAMGNESSVGVISIPSDSYDPDKWWRNSHGFRDVTKETIAWIYARFLFFPSDE